MKNNMIKRLVMYFVGLFIMTIGIALSVKSNLGVSPVSSIPYTMTCIWGIEMGKATIIFHCILVLAQIILLRKKFKLKSLLQIAVGIIFGYFTTFCNWGVSFLPNPENIMVRIGMMLLSTVVVAFGIFLYMPPNIMPLAGEGAMQAVSDISGIPFPKVKIGFDISMVLISLTACLWFIKGFGSVGIGTISAAVLVGTVLGIISKKFGRRRDKWLGMWDNEQTVVPNEENRFVITIAREYGSGGREIGKTIAANLGIAYYDLDIIRKAAKENGLTESQVSKNEQSVRNTAIQSLYYWCVQSTSESELPIVERIYHTQEKIIRECANEQSCVIVGRLSNFILKDYSGIKVFIGADMDSKIERVSKREGLNAKAAESKIQKVENERANHCYYFTHKHWKDAENYDFYIKSDILGIEKTAKMIEDMVRDKCLS
jgi:uncharacterized membrane protein YczE/cytidylate kinase